MKFYDMGCAFNIQIAEALDYKLGVNQTLVSIDVIVRFRAGLGHAEDISKRSK